ncbi:MAG: glycosyl transferase [Pedobacter sp.]|nr:MAG: glycosyl transferase [Pedobacter sp.]
MEPDSALYAYISKTIVLKDDWLNLYVRGADWLDKPHLTFWISAFSFKIFGINPFAFKLPSYLFGLLGAWYTFKLGARIYSEKVGLLSALIWLSSLHVLLSTFDVRAEIYITTFTLASIYHYYRAHTSSFWQVVLGSFFAACAIMIKGIFVLFPVFMGFIIFWLFSGDYKQLMKPKWYLAVVLVLVFITPELYSLYYQFDLQPEKVVFGTTGVSGLKFFFWDSQFGRFFNTGPIKGRGDIAFFLHTTLWAFLPWSILFYTAVVNLFKKTKRVEMPKESIILWASALVTFLLFSFSKFQLPHYILIILPQFAIITAYYLVNLKEKGIKVFTIVQNCIFVLVLGLLITIAFVFDMEAKLIVTAIMVLLSISAFLVFRAPGLTRLVGRSSFLSIILMIFLSGFFYPSLLKYQSGMQAGKWLDLYMPKAQTGVLMHRASFSFDFYAPTDPKYFDSFEELDAYKDRQGMVLYVSKQYVEELKLKYDFEVLRTFDYYHTTKLKPKFLNSKTRKEVLEQFFLLKFK